MSSESPAQADNKAAHADLGRVGAVGVDGLLLELGQIFPAVEGGEVALIAHADSQADHAEVNTGLPAHLETLGVVGVLQAHVVCDDIAAAAEQTAAAVGIEVEAEVEAGVRRYSKDLGELEAVGEVDGHVEAHHHGGGVEQIVNKGDAGGVGLGSIVNEAGSGASVDLNAGAGLDEEVLVGLDAEGEVYRSAVQCRRESACGVRREVKRGVTE